MEQGTDEWVEARKGFLTSSHIDAVLAKGKGVTRRNYKVRVFLERMTGVVHMNDFSNRYMDDGIEQEPFARGMYEAVRGEDVEQVGFLIHPDMQFFGASPDGLVGTDGLTEYKCPSQGVHWDYYDNPKVPRKYVLQMQGQMMVTNRQWCDWVSYNKDFPPHMQLIVRRVERDERLIEEITAGLMLLNSEIDVRVEEEKVKAEEVA